MKYKHPDNLSNLFKPDVKSERHDEEGTDGASSQLLESLGAYGSSENVPPEQCSFEFKCNQCDSSYPSLSKLSRHSMKEHFGATEKCVPCSLRTTSLQLHLENGSCNSSMET